MIFLSLFVSFSLRICVDICSFHSTIFTYSMKSNRLNAHENNMCMCATFVKFTRTTFGCVEILLATQSTWTRFFCDVEFERMMYHQFCAYGLPLAHKSIINIHFGWMCSTANEHCVSRGHFNENEFQLEICALVTSLWSFQSRNCKLFTNWKKKISTIFELSLIIFPGNKLCIWGRECIIDWIISSWNNEKFNLAEHLRLRQNVWFHSWEQVVCFSQYVME